MPSSSSSEHTPPKTGTTKGRLGVFDLVRGVSVVSMVLFHLCYDLKFIAGYDLEWFEPPLQDVWRCSISWVFLFIAGCMCTLSRNNLRRALEYGGVALAIWVVTTIVAVDTPISFGIIYCMSACTLVAWALQRIDALPRGRVAAFVLFVGFVALLGLSDGTIGIGPLKLDLPQELTSVEGLAWLGLPSASFSSGDYYPLLPYLLIYLCGAAMAARWKERGYPAWAYSASVAPLNFVGRHALLVYVIHQPVILAVCALLGS